jgi:hypothetical protein
MQIIRNERRIKLFASLGKYGSLAGFIVLMGNLVISWIRPEWFSVMIATLPLAVALTIFGGFFADRYGGPLAHHEALASALKGLDDRYALLSYKLPATHVLVEPGGCTVFVVKAIGGEVSFDSSGRWRHVQRGKLFRQLAGQEAIGTPHRVSELQANKMRRWLSEHDLEAAIPLRSAIVFVNPNVRLDVADAPAPTFHGKQVKSWLRGTGRLKQLSAPVSQRLRQGVGLDQPEPE